MRNLTRAALIEAHKELLAKGETDQSLTEFERSLEDEDSLEMAEVIEKIIDSQVKKVIDWMASKGYTPYHGNWRLIKPHWVGSSGQPESFEDIYKLYLAENESK